MLFSMQALTLCPRHSNVHFTRMHMAAAKGGSLVSPSGEMRSSLFR